MQSENVDANADWIQGAYMLCLNQVTAVVSSNVCSTWTVISFNADKAKMCLICRPPPK